MAIFSGFNQLNSKISSAFSNVRQVTQNINSFTANIGRVSSQFNSFVSNNPIMKTIGEVSDTVRNVQGLFGTGGVNSKNVGSSIRMIGNAVQNVGYNAAPPDRTISRAVISSDIGTADASDWRVSISIPSILLQGNVLAPLKESSDNSSAWNTGNRMIFPFNPTILLGHSANYAQIQPTHTNYVFNAFENSQVDNITITGEFINENEYDARYWIACLHFLRTATKMFYGESFPAGNPPPVCRLNGYGKHVLNNIPVIITNFTTDMPADVDYIECQVDGQKNMVPVQSTFTITCAPNYARRTTARFSLNDFAKGGFVGGNEGFV
jgi:hypothetical protein|tara:strand:+ start:65 stop:1033 length:969 start_codon:yes stop_codon:yes gene_type:complete